MISSQLFELIILLLGIGSIVYAIKTKKINQFLFIFIGLLFFSIISRPMWFNDLSFWAYLSANVSWLLILGFSAVFMISDYVVSTFFKPVSKMKQILYQTIVITLITTPLEIILFLSGMRMYSAELMETMSGILIPLTQAPIEIILTIPLMVLLVYPFSQYLHHLFCPN